MRLLPGQCMLDFKTDGERSVGAAHSAAFHVVRRRRRLRQDRSVFIVPMIHLDIGFTATPGEVASHYRSDVDLALRRSTTSRRSLEYRDLLAARSSGCRSTRNSRRLSSSSSAIESGRLGIGASYASMHSSCRRAKRCSACCTPRKSWPERVRHAARDGRHERRPGFAWYLPQALQCSGSGGSSSGPTSSLTGDVPSQPTCDRSTGPVPTAAPSSPG